MVVALRGERGDRPRRRIDAGGGRVVGKGDQSVGIGDVERVADQGHAERRGEAGDIGVADLGDAVAVGVAQQGDAVGARHRRAGFALEQAEEEALDAVILMRRVRRRPPGFGDEDVAIGKGQQPAGVLEAGRERANL